MTQKRIDDCLSNRDGVLFIEEVAAPELIEQFGSPLFAFSEDQIRRNVRRFRDAFEKGCFSFYRCIWYSFTCFFEEVKGTYTRC